MWFVPLACALAGTALLAWLAASVRREVGPTRTVLDELGRELQPALIRVRDENERLRARLDRRP